MTTGLTGRMLSVAFQPNRTAGLDAEDLVAKLRAVADGSVLQLIAEDRGNDGGPYVNLTYSSADHVAAWTHLLALYDDSESGGQLAASTISRARVNTAGMTTCCCTISIQT